MPPPTRELLDSFQIQAERHHQLLYEEYIRDGWYPTDTDIEWNTNWSNFNRRWEASFGVPGTDMAKKWITDTLFPLYVAGYHSAMTPVKPPKKAKEIRYFLTFTVDPKKGCTFDDLEWWVKDQCRRKLFLRVKVAYEHVERNMHAHVDAICKESIHKGPNGDFKSVYDNLGWLDIQGPITEDNGMHKYITKEAKEIFTLDNTVPKPQWLSQKVVRVAQPTVEGPDLVL